jgi:hypothetical protein
MSKDPAVVLRVAVSAGAIIAAVAHMLFRTFIPDAITAGLIILAFVPWLSPIIKSIEVTGLGKLELNKLELKVEDVKEKQALLREEVDGLRFLVSGFVTDFELIHLKKLAGEARFDYVKGAGHDDRFINEIIRLRDFGLVKKLIPHSLYDIPRSGDLRDYVELTERGRTYLKLRQQLQA